MRKWVWAWCGVALAVATATGVMYEASAGHKGVREVKTQQRVVALTFDDGPDEVTTIKLLQVLKEHNAKATFFVMGRRAEELPEQLAQIASEGHEIGSHGFSHKWLTKLSDQELAEEITRTEAVIMTAAPKPVLFRPPGAYYNERIIQELRNRGYSMIMWSIDTRDWARQDYTGVAHDVATKVKPGSIVLLHDGHYAPGTPKAVAIIAGQLSKQGYRFVTISELLQYNEERN